MARLPAFRLSFLRKRSNVHANSLLVIVAFVIMTVFDLPAIRLSVDLQNERSFDLFFVKVFQ